MKKICLDDLKKFEELDFVQPHEKKPVELYLLTCDGCQDSYGSMIYAIGIYPTEFEAMQNANELPKDLDWIITPIILGETYKLDFGDEFTGYCNGKKLGGYIE